MRPLKTQVWRPFLLELAVYGVCLSAYFLCVLHFLGAWLESLFLHERATYALVAIVLVIGQAVGLEVLTSAILRWVRQRAH